MTNPSSDGSGMGKTSEIFPEICSVKSKKRVQDWVNSSPAGNMADVATDPSLNFCCGIALPNQAIFPPPSSTQPLNSHSNLNKNCQVQAKINPLSMSRQNQVVRPM